jgi:hypothetical protein
MRPYSFLTAVVCALLAAGTTVADEKRTFEDANAGRLPKGGAAFSGRIGEEFCGSGAARVKYGSSLQPLILC